jgi:hypothetical protein
MIQAIPKIHAGECMWDRRNEFLGSPTGVWEGDRAVFESRMTNMLLERWRRTSGPFGIYNVYEFCVKEPEGGGHGFWKA